MAQSFTVLPRPPLVGNNDDRRQWRKQGGVVGAAASRTRVLCTMWTLGAATRTGGIPQGMTVGFNLPRAITPRRGGACSASGPHHQWQRWPALQCKVHCPAQHPCRGNQRLVFWTSCIHVGIINSTLDLSSLSGVKFSISNSNSVLHIVNSNNNSTSFYLRTILVNFILNTSRQVAKGSENLIVTSE